MVPSRVAAKFGFEIADWDRVCLHALVIAYLQVGSATPLGGNSIDLSTLEPFEASERHFPVMMKGAEHGTLACRLLFQPESRFAAPTSLTGPVIARSRQKTSTFSSAGRAITTIGGVPLEVGKGVLHGGTAVASGVGHGIGTVGGFAGRKIGLIKKKNGEIVEAPLDVEQDGNEQATASSDEPGILYVTVLGARGLHSKEGTSLKSYVSLKMGTKAHKTAHVKGAEPDWYAW